MDIYIHIDTLRCSPEPGHVNLIKSSMESFHSEVFSDMSPLAFRLGVTAIHTCKSAQRHERLGCLNSEGGRIAYLPDLNTVDSADIIWNRICRWLLKHFNVATWHVTYLSSMQSLPETNVICAIVKGLRTVAGGKNQKKEAEDPFFELDVEDR